MYLQIRLTFRNVDGTHGYYGFYVKPREALANIRTLGSRVRVRVREHELYADADAEIPDGAEDVACAARLKGDPRVLRVLARMLRAA